jgi:hypothetical protein
VTTVAPSNAETDIATQIQALGFGTLGTTIFVNTRPESPDDLIAVFGYAGQAPDRNHAGEAIDNPSVQVWVRNTSNGTARQIIEQIYQALDGMFNTYLSGTFYLEVTALQCATPMGKDEADRSEYVVNFTCSKIRSY